MQTFHSINLLNIHTTEAYICVKNPYYVRN
jgi:hypothetical protein